MTELILKRAIKTIAIHQGKFHELATKDFNSGVLWLRPDADKINETHVLMMGMLGSKNEFRGCEFLFKVEFPLPKSGYKGYPYEPPMFTALTPNGIYIQGNSTPCVSIGTYHAHDDRGVYGFNAAMGAYGFFETLWGSYSIPEELGHGISIQVASFEGRRQVSEGSRAYNEKNHEGIMKRFAEQYDLEARRKYWEEKNARDIAEEAAWKKKKTETGNEAAASQDLQTALKAAVETAKRAAPAAPQAQAAAAQTEDEELAAAIAAIDVATAAPQEQAAAALTEDEELAAAIAAIDIATAEQEAEPAARAAPKKAGRKPRPPKKA